MRAPYSDSFSDLGTFAIAVAAATRHGSSAADPRLFAATGMHEAIGAEGGFAVPDEWSEGIWQRAYLSGEILRRTDRQPVTGNKLKIPAVHETSRADGSRTGGARVAWVPEAGLITASISQMALAAFEPKKLAGLCYATDELLADAPALEVWLRRAFSTEAAFLLEDEIINGIGGARPLGILNAPATITVPKEASQPAATITVNNILAMWARLPAASRKNAVWLCNVDTEAALARLRTPIRNDAGNDTVGAIELAYFPPGSFGSPFATLQGCPVIPVEYTPAIGTRGDIILADLSAYAVIEKEPTFLSSIHVRFLNDETAFRFTFRADGAPLWQASVQRRNSGVTESPFIVLESRS